MKRLVGVLLIVSILAGMAPVPAHARIGKGTLALIAGASVAACVAGIMASKNQKEYVSRTDRYEYRWDAKRIAAASIGSGALVGGLTFVFLTARDGRNIVGIRYTVSAQR